MTIGTLFSCGAFVPTYLSAPLAEGPDGLANPSPQIIAENSDECDGERKPYEKRDPPHG